MNPPLIYRKALELCELSRAIASYVTHHKDSLFTDSILIQQQIDRAEKSDNPVVRFRTTRFISVMIRNLQGYTNGLEHHGVKEKEYLNLLRKEIKSFKRAFKKWSKSLGTRNGDGNWGYQDYLGY